MATPKAVHKTSDMLGQNDEEINAPTPSDRDLRAMRRGMGIPAARSPSPEFLAQGRRPTKRKVDSDTEFDEVCWNLKYFQTSSGLTQ